MSDHGVPPNVFGSSKKCKEGEKITRWIAIAALGFLEEERKNQWIF